MALLTLPGSRTFDTMMSTLRWPLRAFGRRRLGCLLECRGAPGKRLDSRVSTSTSRETPGAPTREAAVEVGSGSRRAGRRRCAGGPAGGGSRIGLSPSRETPGAQARLGKALFLGLGREAGLPGGVALGPSSRRRGLCSRARCAGGRVQHRNGVAQDFEELCVGPGPPPTRETPVDGPSWRPCTTRVSAACSRTSRRRLVCTVSAPNRDTLAHSFSWGRCICSAMAWSGTSSPRTCGPSLGASGPGVSTGALDVQTRFMTPEQIAEAEARVRDWGK